MKLFLFLFLSINFISMNLFAQYYGDKAQAIYDCDLNGLNLTIEVYSRSHPSYPTPRPAPSRSASYNFLKIISNDGTVTGSGYFKISEMGIENEQKIFAIADFEDAQLYRCTKKPNLEPVLIVKTGYLIQIAGIGGESTGIGLSNSEDGSVIELDGVNETVRNQLYYYLRRPFRAAITVEGKFVRKGGIAIPMRNVFIVHSIRTFN